MVLLFYLAYIAWLKRKSCQRICLAGTCLVTLEDEEGLTKDEHYVKDGDNDV